MDPFAVLGVSPAANESEIREAYLRRSKELHPDRYADRSPAEQASATRAMQELNAAYDEIRRGPAPPPPSSDYYAPPPPPTYTPAAAPPRGRVRWFAVLIAVLVLASFLAALSGGGSKRGPVSPTANFDQLEGECVTFDEVGRPDEAVDCTRPHDARIMRVVDHGAGCPVWTDQTVAGMVKDLCLDTRQ